MYQSAADKKYLSDPTFHKVVDSLYSLLGYYQVTPSELREAAILAATMHEARRIHPLFHKMAEAEDIPPAMFGGTRYSSTAPFTEHVFSRLRSDHCACVRCNLSDVYVKAYSITECKPKE
jgi:hypothetical protein